MRNQTKLTRRQLLRLSALTGIGAAIAACAPQSPSQPSQPSTTEQQPTPQVQSRLPSVPREKTLILGWSFSTGDIGNVQPWTQGYTHQQLNNLLWEPLFYFAIFADKEVPWLAESGTYSSDFKELTIKLRKEAQWSDGTPITSKDVAFTFNGHLNNDKLKYHAEFKEFVESIETPDEQTVVVKFNKPAPRFKFEVLSQKFDTGIEIVPEHVLSKEADVVAFKGDYDMPISGPYRIVAWNADQKILDRRDDWWAVKAGIATLPDVQRVIVVNIGGTVGTNMQAVAQRLVNNEMDASLDMRDALIKSTLEKNPKITTHTGNEPPRGYLDWWPNSLWVNHEIEPFNDVRVRRAISLSLNRDQIDEVVYDGAQITTIFPFPLYPGLQAFADSPGVKALIEKYQPRKYDLAEAERLMNEAGFTKNADGLFEKDGKTVPCVINGFEGIHSDIVPILVEQLRAAGFDASINFGPDAYQNMADGKPGLYMFGHGASLKDPYAVFFLFTKKPVGNTAGANNFSRYNNPAFDQLVAEMGPLPAEDPKFQELAVKAMEIYWQDQIDIPVIQWLHRIPYNQTYWVNWPTRDNLGPGCNGAFWAFTGMLVVTNLKSAA